MPCALQRGVVGVAVAHVHIGDMERLINPNQVVRHPPRLMYQLHNGVVPSDRLYEDSMIVLRRTNDGDTGQVYLMLLQAANEVVSAGNGAVDSR